MGGKNKINPHFLIVSSSYVNFRNMISMISFKSIQSKSPRVLIYFQINSYLHEML